MVTPSLSLETMRHSCSHLLALAVQSLYPSARFGVGPATKDGFYYDIEFPAPISETDLKQIEEKMLELKKAGLAYERLQYPIEQAIDLMRQSQQKYKVELLELLRDRGTTAVAKAVDEDFTADQGKINEVSIYRLGQFVDLCRGPHVPNTKEIGVFKLTSLAGAYWRGDVSQPQLQRIYGLCFHTKADLEQREWQIEEAKKRDHRLLGQQQNIYCIPEEAGQGLPLWLPNGAVIRHELEYLARIEEHKAGYVPVATPCLAKEALYIRSGHLPYYQEDMYAPIDIEGEKYYLRPMNCPHHHQVYLARLHSYRELPVRLAEYGQVFRYEASGALTGLLRTRGFCQNDAHIYCRYDQAQAEFLKTLQLHAHYYQLFGIDSFYMRLSLPDLTAGNKYVNQPEAWQKAIDIIRAAMTESGLSYIESEGEAAFYGPKIDFMIQSAIGQEYAISTTQLDFLASERFGLSYVGEDGGNHPVYVIHRAPLGSHERFIAFLLEHYAGNFPTWIAPVQIRIIPIAEKHYDYAKSLETRLSQVSVHSACGGMRLDVDWTHERMQKKILRSQQNKIPYMIIIGDNEVAQQTLSVRRRDGVQINSISIDNFVEGIQQEISSRSLAFKLST